MVTRLEEAAEEEEASSMDMACHAARALLSGCGDEEGGAADSGDVLPLTPAQLQLCARIEDLSTTMESMLRTDPQMQLLHALRNSDPILEKMRRMWDLLVLESELGGEGGSGGGTPTERPPEAAAQTEAGGDALASGGGAGGGGSGGWWHWVERASGEVTIGAFREFHCRLSVVLAEKQSSGSAGGQLLPDGSFQLPPEALKHAVEEADADWVKLDYLVHALSWQWGAAQG
jgi:hypothetical protein